jgi:hypothetical protein
MTYSQCQELVIKSKSYKNLNFIQKTMVKKHRNIKEILHCVEVIKNIGFVQWEKQSKVNHINKMIIKETPLNI